MKILFSVLCSFILLSATAQENQVDAKGRKQGAWSKTYPKSKILQYKGQFKDDKPVGTFTYYYSSGKVKAVIKHDDNSTRSSAYLYHENGLLMSHGIYRNMKKDSVWLNFTPAGRLSTSETFKEDLLDGKKIVFYVPESLENKSRLPSAVYIYSKGKLNGEAIEYFETGVVKSKGMYKDDKKIGVWEAYHPSGKKMMLERFKDGIHHGWHFAYNEAGVETNKKYYYYGRVLEGKALEEKMRQMKELGINPNG
ncbi:MAG: toxin-antitoxin system YwqK family antitoxin [Bacteroidota bacterium]|jgi:antitoxin component YwqK of YwqJK toxin-antitoxin module